MAKRTKLIDGFKHEVMSEFIRLCRGNDFNKLTLLTIGDTIDRLYEKYSTLPSVDAVEVVHGHWCWEGNFKACSNCGSYVEWNETLGANFWKFCPYCGAKMDGERKEDETT